MHYKILRSMPHLSTLKCPRRIFDCSVRRHSLSAAYVFPQMFFQQLTPMLSANWQPVKVVRAHPPYAGNACWLSLSIDLDHEQPAHPKKHSTRHDLRIMKHALVRGRKQTNVLQSVRHRVYRAQQVILISPPPQIVIDPHFAVESSQHSHRHLLKIPSSVEHTLRHFCGGKRPSGVAMVKISRASAASGICQHPCSLPSFSKHEAPNK